MEAIKQDGIETAAGGQRTRMSNARMVFIGAMALAAFYMVWGIAKVIS